MNDKKIKLWISILVATLMITGAVASYAASKNNLYKGVDNLKSYASVIQYDEPAESGVNTNNSSRLKKYSIVEPNKRAFSPQQTAEIISSSFNPANAVKNIPAAPQFFLPTLTPAPQSNTAQQSVCERGTLIIKDGKVAGCE